MAAELARRGFTSTTFTGNVPHYDIIASNEKGEHVCVQVKAIRGRSWQFSITSFCPVDHSRGRQKLGRAKRVPIPGLICVMVVLRDYGQDDFFICTWEQLRDKIVRDYRRMLRRNNGRRKRKPESTHTKLLPETLLEFKDDWRLIHRSLR